MGFCQPVQLVRDAGAHGVEVRVVDVQVSGWDSTLEPLEPADAGPANGGDPLHAVRLGLSRVSGLSEAAAKRIVTARDGHGHGDEDGGGDGSGPSAAFTAAEDVARRARLDAHDLQALAGAGALRAAAGHRHQAAWAVAGIDTRATAAARYPCA